MIVWINVILNILFIYLFIYLFMYNNDIKVQHKTLKEKEEK